MKAIPARAFGFNTTPANIEAGTIGFKKLSLQEARALLEGGFVSAVGHAETARIASALLGLPVAPNRATVTLGPGEGLVLPQYRAPGSPRG